MKETLYKGFPFAGFKEYGNGRGWLFGFDVDVGPIVFGLSPTGTAFGIGSTTYFKDLKLRKKLSGLLKWQGLQSYGKERGIICLQIWRL